MTSETLSHETAINKCGELAALVDQQIDGKGNGAHAAIDPLLFARECDPLPPQCTVSANRISPLWCRAKNKCC